MMNNIAGRFWKYQLRSIYSYFDYPVLFSYRDEHALIHVCILWEQHQDNREMMWMDVVISSERLEKFEKGDIQIRDLFLYPELGQLTRIYEHDNDFTTSPVFVLSLTDDDLPALGEYINRSERN